MNIETYNSIKVILGATPEDADVAIVSIDSSGNLVALNTMVLQKYGYNESELPSEEKLISGFYGLYKEGKKPIIFVVTVGIGDVSQSLSINLFNALTEFKDWFRNKKIWLPLLGTGQGRLSYIDSYNIMVEVVDNFIKSFGERLTIILSVPPDEQGKRLFTLVQNNPDLFVDQNDIVKSKERAFSFLKNLNCNFYLVGTIWNREDQLKRFIKEGTWEKGFEDESYSSIINEVQRDDILIVKSTFASNAISYLRIKAFGVVKANLNDGTRLKVEWRITNIEFDIDHLGYYRSTIAAAELNDVAHILSFLDSSLWKRLLPPNTTVKANFNSIAGLVSDSEKGIDYLAITKDIDAFARVMVAKSFEPPLAVALFGKWGSGKSFFMRTLKDKIISLSQRNPFNAYCEGVVHIHFNAWSYMDANLWASIVTKIFEGLYGYISENSLSGEKQNIEKQLSEQLTIAKEEIAILESKKSSVASQIETLEKRKGVLEKDLKDKIGIIEKKTLWNVIENVNNEFNAREKILAALKENPSFSESEDKLKELVPERYWNDPKVAYEKAKSKYTFLHEFFNGNKAIWNIIILASILAIILFTPYYIIFISDAFRNANFIIPQSVFSFFIIIAAIWKRAEATYKNLQPVIASFWKIKVDFDKQIEEEVSKYEQEEKALKLEIEKDKAELIVVDQQIQQAVTLKADLEFRINNALATEALYSFIEKRAKSEDYKKHLGIISTIRRDFEILNDLFTDHNSEAAKIKSAKEFRSKFKKPLERIILYIDDLDRCPEENVVQVLEAVNLLMAFPLFVVIVGVDPRWVKNALLKKHSLQFIDKQRPDEHLINGFEAIEPSNYLEKIFQIPFHLKEAANENVKEMIRKLAQAKPIAGVETSTKSEEDKVVAGDVNKTDINKITITQAAPDSKNHSELLNAPTAIDISEKEVLLLQDMGEIIGSNPRAIKRFLNSYRILKAHEDFTYDSAFEEKELLVVMFLLALPISNYRKLLKTFEDFIQKDGNQNKPMARYFESNNRIPDDNLNTLKQNLNILLSDKRSFQIIQREMAGAFLKHNSLIRRFTFKNL